MLTYGLLMFEYQRTLLVLCSRLSGKRSDLAVLTVRRRYCPLFMNA
jgi:hypothetical protein